MTITFPIDWQKAEELLALIRGRGFESLTLALHEGLSNEAERHQERRNEDYYGGSGPQTERERQLVHEMATNAGGIY